jgi:hypothetical protein
MRSANGAARRRRLVWRDGDTGWGCPPSQRLLRLAERYTPERVEAACARALGFDLLDVRRLERILVLALEHEGQAAPPSRG